MSKKIYYVYKIIRPWNNEIAYVGKGSGNRLYSHRWAALRKIHKNVHLQNIYLKAQRLNLEVIEELVKTNLTEDEALSLEKELILFYGRKDLNTGTLINLKDGGENPGNMSLETKKKLREYFLGHPVSFETREKIRKSLTGKTHSKETKQKMSEQRKGSNHPMFGKTHSKETKQRWSEKRKGVVLKENHKLSISEGVKRNWEKRKNYPISAETREKRRQNALKQWAARKALLSQNNGVDSNKNSPS